MEVPCMRKKKIYYLPVITGFIILYLISMTAATWLVHQKYMEEFEMRYDIKEKGLFTSLSYKNLFQNTHEESLRDRVLHTFSYIFSTDSEKYQQFSAAFYDYATQELIKTQNSLSISKTADTCMTQILNDKMNEKSTNQLPDSEFKEQYSGIRYICSDDGEIVAALIMTSECHPWRAAVNYMKYVYIICLMLMLICLVIVLYVLYDTRQKRAAMEENRLYFTNALAHEMKTPLGIIRGFSENMIENTVPEKKAYYLEQILKKTGEIEYLTEELSDMSKLDSEHILLQREKLSVGDMIREQLDKMAPVIEERKLKVQLQETEPFHITGDRKYLSKALFNLVDNAVSYCDAGGIITIRTDKTTCCIENPCPPIENDKLVHLFDAFYQIDTNRSTRGSHYGIGLYLTKKILNLFCMNIVIENTENGIRVIVSARADFGKKV